MSRNVTQSPLLIWLFQSMVVIVISVALLVITGALRDDGPYDTIGDVLFFYFVPYFVAAQFFGGSMESRAGDNRSHSPLQLFLRT